MTLGTAFTGGPATPDAWVLPLDMATAAAHLLLSVGSRGVGTPALQVFETGQFLAEDELHHPGRPVAVLCDQDLGDAGLLGLVPVVVLVSVEKHHQVAVLFDAARLS